MNELKPKFREKEFVYFIEDETVTGDVIHKYVKKWETKEIKYLVGNHIRSEREIFHTRLEAENLLKGVERC